MRTVKNHTTLKFLLALALFIRGGALLALPPDPDTTIRSPAATPGLATSTGHLVVANGVPVWTELLDIPTPSGPDLSHRERSFLTRAADVLGKSQTLAVARFSTDKETTVEITSTAGPIRDFKVRPLGRKTEVSGQGTSTLTFRIRPGEKLYLEFDILAPLLLVADAPEQNPPAIGDGNVRHFGPGEHHPGDIIPKNGETIYLAPGAIVYGRIIASKTENLKILGRGILDASREEGGVPIRLTKCKSVLIEGITIRNTRPGWLCVPTISTDVTLRNLVILGFAANNDGIDVFGSSRVLIEDCFLRCTDDCIAIKSTLAVPFMENIVIRNCIMYGFASADGLTIGFEISAPVRNVKVTGCDIIGAHGPGTTGGHSAFSIVCDGPGPVENILFENIRVEEKVRRRNFEITVTNGRHYVGKSPGNVRNIIIRNVDWKRADRPFVLHGHGPGNTVSNVVFENCTVAGKPLAGFGDALFQTNEFISGIRFQP